MEAYEHGGGEVMWFRFNFALITKNWAFIEYSRTWFLPSYRRRGWNIPFTALRIDVRRRRMKMRFFSRVERIRNEAGKITSIGVPMRKRWWLLSPFQFLIALSSSPLKCFCSTFLHQFSSSAMVVAFCYAPSVTRASSSSMANPNVYVFRLDQLLMPFFVADPLLILLSFLSMNGEMENGSTRNTGWNSTCEFWTLHWWSGYEVLSRGGGFGS